VGDGIATRNTLSRSARVLTFGGMRRTSMIGPDIVLGSAFQTTGAFA
jgi:hypothetical protein